MRFFFIYLFAFFIFDKKSWKTVYASPEFPTDLWILWGLKELTTPFT